MWLATILSASLILFAQFIGQEKKPEDLLFEAAWSGDVQTVTKLLADGVNVNARDGNGYTALMHATSDSPRFEIVMFLLENGADVSNIANSGATALTLSAYRGHAEIAEALLKRGADANYADPDDEGTIMGLAAEYGNPETLGVLIRYGTNVNARGKKGETALMSASRGGKVDAVKALLAAGADIISKDESGKTAMEYARETGNDNLIQLLEEAKAK